jgi:type IV pilus assembly protein PilB
MYVSPDALKKFLLESNLVTPSDIESAEKQSVKTGDTLGNVLVSQGKLKEDELQKSVGYVLGIPFLSLENEDIDFETLSLIPEPIVRAHNIVAYRKKENGLEVAMMDVDDLVVLDSLKKKLGIRLLPRLTDSPSIQHALTLYKKTLRDEFQDIIDKESSNVKALKVSKDGETVENEKELKELAEDLPIVKIVDSLISHAILQGSSDIHMEPHEEAFYVRYRIDGLLRDAMVLPKKTAGGIVARIKVLSNLKLDEKRLPQDGRFKIEQDGMKVSFRVSTLPVYYGEKVVIRILKENSKGFSLEGLGFHGSSLERAHEALKQHIGMIVAAGPTGSGKSTTLYTMLDMVNTPEVNISTVEDPVEYQMARVNQTQVRPEIGLTFANGLRTLLRQDPDIVMVGEIRDGETAGIAVNAALTGHLVLSTIHTNSAAGAIPRFIDMGVPPFLLVSTLKIVIAQRLVRRLSATKEKYFMNDTELLELSKFVNLDRMLDFLRKENIVGPNDTWRDIPFYKAVPGGDSETGYKSRVGLHEALKLSPAIKELILKGATDDEVEKQAKEEGMMTMLEDGIFLAVQGQTTIEEVLRVINE